MPAQHLPRTWTTLDSSVWIQNLRAMAGRVDNQLHRIIPVVKADAYGHGVSRLPWDLLHKTRGVGVATAVEAAELRRGGFTGRIYLLSPSFPGEMRDVVAANAIPLVSTLEELAAWDSLVAINPQKLAINLELDTGMGRSGLLPTFDADFTRWWRSQPHSLTLDSVSSHFASADEDAIATAAQVENYEARLAQFQTAGIVPEIAHLANSAGSMATTQGAERVIRTGIALCGWSPIAEFQSMLRQPLSWHTRVLLVRTLPAGWRVSYGGTHQCQKATRVATLGVGYADGYPRALSGKKADVLISGVRCPILGRVTMDQLIADVSHLPEASVVPGTIVTVLGIQGSQSITAAELAEKAGTIPYEIFTSIGKRVVQA